MKERELEDKPALGAETGETLKQPVSSGMAGARLAFVDNLRWVMIVLVVSMHAAVTYSHLGSWYFMEDPKPGPGLTAVFATYQTFLQAFFMGLLFLLAGYFVPEAFDRKGFRKFFHDRAVRLGVPSLFFMLVIQPFTVFWLLPFGRPSRPPFFRSCWHYLASGRFLSGSGPMWFALALLGFTLVYAMVRMLGGRAPQNEAHAPLPTLRQTVWLALVMGLCTFLVRIAQPIGTDVLNMQLCFFSQYVLLFAAGIQARRKNWLLRLDYAFGARWLAVACAGGSLVWLALVSVVLRSHTETKLFGGFTWQSAALSFWESFFCVGACLGLLVFFREKWNCDGALARWLSRNSFSVYMFHTPILIAITFMIHDWQAPKLAKFLVATILGVTAAYLASSLVFRRIPLLKKVL